MNTLTMLTLDVHGNGDQQGQPAAIQVAITPAVIHEIRELQQIAIKHKLTAVARANDRPSWLGTDGTICTNAAPSQVELLVGPEAFGWQTTGGCALRSATFKIADLAELVEGEPSVGNETLARATDVVTWLQRADMFSVAGSPLLASWRFLETNIAKLGPAHTFAHATWSDEDAGFREITISRFALDRASWTPDGELRIESDDDGVVLVAAYTLTRNWTPAP
jgi:hypothetical protein